MKKMEILQEYDQQHALYSDFTEKVEELIGELLNEKSIKIHSITSRIKKRQDLDKKLDRTRRDYSKLGDITDISGIRVITYFADDVDTVAKVIEKEFDIDIENSVDKRASLDPDRFGYVSLHYIVSFPISRLQLTEYRKFSDCKAEIQVRSILQHAWAEIEHDLGYKSKDAVPKDIRRRFSRLSGLLEIADNEFIQIRNSLREYENIVPEMINENPASVLIDQASLAAFIKNSILVHNVDTDISTITKIKLLGNVGDLAELPEMFVNNLRYVGLETISDIDSMLREFGDVIVRFAGNWLVGSKDDSAYMPNGICLFYLCYILIARSGPDKVINYLNTFNIEESEEQREIMARDVISVYDQSKDENNKIKA